jgi:fructoselysine-6-P-deglycase FrlB-like protein
MRWGYDMADANAMFNRIKSKLSEKECVDIFYTANGGSQVLAACIIAEGLAELGKSIERAAKVSRK